jgi:hypothetical protein
MLLSPEILPAGRDGREPKTDRSDGNSFAGLRGRRTNREIIGS